MFKVAKKDEERFWDKVIPEPNSGCWLWLGSSRKGNSTRTEYGQFRLGSLKDGSLRLVAAHRMAFELVKGPIPEGTEIMHSCDNGLCVNPDHLTAGTHHQNVLDACARIIKFAKGSFHGRAKLTEEIVVAIRASNESGPKLARKFGVGKSAVQAAKSGKTWRHV